MWTLSDTLAEVHDEVPEVPVKVLEKVPVDALEEVPNRPLMGSLNSLQELWAC